VKLCKEKQRRMIEQEWKCLECQTKNQILIRLNERTPACVQCGTVKPNQNKRRKGKDDPDFNPNFSIESSARNEFGFNVPPFFMQYKPLNPNAKSLLVDGERYKIKRKKLLTELENGSYNKADNPNHIMKPGFLKMMDTIDVDEKTVLDIGVGRGELLQFFLDDGWVVGGIEKCEENYNLIPKELLPFCKLCDAVQDTRWLDAIKKSSVIIFSNRQFPYSIRQISEHNILTLARKGTIVFTTIKPSFVCSPSSVELIRTISQPPNEGNICLWNNAEIYCYQITNPLPEKILHFSS